MGSALPSELGQIDASGPAKKLILTVGLPRSGKSTAARSLAAKILAPIVNPDAIRLAVHGQRFSAEAEPLVWFAAKVMVRALFRAGHDTVILDATNTTRKRRDEWKSEEWRRDYLQITTSKLTCVQRASAEGDVEIIPVIERMAHGFEELSAEDYAHG